MKRDRDGKNVQWTKIRQLRVEKEFPSTLKIKNDFDEDFREILVSGSRRNVAKSKLPMLYESDVAISVEKKKDLVSLCDTGVVPSLYHHYYRELKAVGDSDSEPESQSEDDGDHCGHRRVINVLFLLVLHTDHNDIYLAGLLYSMSRSTHFKVILIFLYALLAAVVIARELLDLTGVLLY